MAAIQGAAAEKIIRTTEEILSVLVNILPANSHVPNSDATAYGGCLVAMVSQPGKQPFVVLQCPFGEIASTSAQIKNITEATCAAEKLHAVASDVRSSRQLADDATLAVADAPVAIRCDDDLVLAFHGLGSAERNEALLLAIGLYSGWLSPDTHAAMSINRIVGELRQQLP